MRFLKKHTITKALLASFIASICAATCLVGYCLYMSVDIDKRFSSRRWKIPSTVYSDSTLLFPGQLINRSSLDEKLKRLGYREVNEYPGKKGQLQATANSVDIYLNDLNLPGRKRPGFLVRILFEAGRIKEIRHLQAENMPTENSSFEDTPDENTIDILELAPEEIMLFFGAEREQRRLVSIDKVPRHLIHAIMAAEDSRFYEHFGVDPKGLLRAVYVNLKHKSIRQGGSTITQQVAKNYFLTPERTFTRKFRELLIALTLEAMYAKDEIMEIYINEIYLGQNRSVSINGFGEAADFFFGKPVTHLTIAESATMAGLIKGPNSYSPYRNPERSRKRRDFVLNRMHLKQWINDAELKTQLAEPVRTSGYTSYGKKAPYFIDYLSKQLKSLYPPEVLQSEGLSIYTTLDTQVQAAAEIALETGLQRLENNNPKLVRDDPLKRLQGAVIVMQPKTGYILAMVGGRNYHNSQFNRITQAKRQPGSLFKPFVYLTGLDAFTPASLLSNKKRAYEIDGKTWEPGNYSKGPEDPVRLRIALAKSLNIPTVGLAMQIGMDRIVDTITDFQFSTSVKPYPSLSLGSFEVIPLELARAYCVFAADGIQTHPLSLKTVRDENGKDLERRHLNIESLITPAKAFMMTSMLQSVVAEGTARSLKNRGISYPVAGKTGTTSGYKDAWFVGYTPDILALVWVGFDNGDSITATGSSAALPVWAELIKQIPQYMSNVAFKKPSGVLTAVICTESGKLAEGRACPLITEEIFLDSNPLEDFCDLHEPKGKVGRIVDGIISIFD